MPTSPFNNGAPPAGAFFAGAPSTVADYLKSRSLLANSHANAKRDVNRSGLSPAQRNAKLQREIAQAGGVPNRQPHGPKTKGSPDQFYAGVADAAGAVANLTGDIADLTLGAPVNAIGSVVDPGAPRLQFNTEPYYGYDQPAGFRASVRDLPHALATAGTDLYNHPLMTLLQQGQYFDPNSFVAPDASSPLPGRSEGAPSVPRDLAPAGEEGAAAAAGVGKVARGASSPVPESYMNKNLGIDMRGAPPGSRVNKNGYPRNSDWYWKQVYARHPEHFSPENAAGITGSRPRAPIVDDQWIKGNPSHAPFKGDILHHHHVDQGHIAVPIPHSVHYGWFRALHPDL